MVTGNQEGYNNGLITSQQGTNGEITATQVSNNSVFDHNLLPGWGYNNYAELNQKGGDGSQMTLSQTGTDNYAGSLQDGNLHIGTITQTGDANYGTITSVGDGHIGSITQTGGMNEAVITQSN